MSYGNGTWVRELPSKTFCACIECLKIYNRETSVWMKKASCNCFFHFWFKFLMGIKWMNELFLLLLHLLWVLLHSPHTSVSEVHPPPTHHVCGGLDEHLNWESYGCTMFHFLPHPTNLIQTSKVHPRLRLHMNRIERLISPFCLSKGGWTPHSGSSEDGCKLKTHPSSTSSFCLSPHLHRLLPRSDLITPRGFQLRTSHHITSLLPVLTRCTTRFICPTLPNLACYCCRHDSSFFPRSFALCFVLLMAKWGS